MRKKDNRKKKEQEIKIIDKEPDRTIDKEYKIKHVDEFTRTLSIISLISFLIGLVIFSYGFAIIDSELGTTESKTFTISRSLGKGNKPGIIIFLTIAFSYLLYLVYYRGPEKYLKLRFFFLIVSFILIISLLWFTPWYNEHLHYALASVIFSFMLLYVILTYYLLYQNYKKNKYLFYSLIGINIIATICLAVFGFITEIDRDVFASFEIVFAFLFGVSILVLGFY